MKKVLVIGSTVVDVIINVDYLPRTTEDVHVRSQETSLGGCAYNVSDMIRHFGVPYTLFSPIGTGIYGDWIRARFAERGLVCPLPTPAMDNGCCYCFVEESGERTFISNHGAEYLICDEWLRQIDVSALAAVYVCGLEVEEKTGGDIVRFLERAAAAGVRVYFAPGPRINRIGEDLLGRIFRCRPVVHLNADEVCSYTRQPVVEDAARALYARTGAPVIVTNGSGGAYFYADGALCHVAPVAAPRIADTIGAGDAHIGACIACLESGMSLAEAVRAANRAASAVVGVKGALLPDEAFRALFGSAPAAQG